MRAHSNIVKDTGWACCYLNRRGYSIRHWDLEKSSPMAQIVPITCNIFVGFCDTIYRDECLTILACLKTALTSGVYVGVASSMRASTYSYLFHPFLLMYLWSRCLVFSRKGNVTILHLLYFRNYKYTIPGAVSDSPIMVFLSCIFIIAKNSLRHAICSWSEKVHCRLSTYIGMDETVTHPPYTRITTFFAYTHSHSTSMVPGMKYCTVQSNASTGSVCTEWTIKTVLVTSRSDYRAAIYTTVPYLPLILKSSGIDTRRTNPSQLHTRRVRALPGFSSSGLHPAGRLGSGLHKSTTPRFLWVHEGIYIYYIKNVAVFFIISCVSQLVSDSSFGSLSISPLRCG